MQVNDFKEELSNLELILDTLAEYSCVSFDYKGKHCGVEPYHDHYDMWYGENISYIAKSIDEVINHKLFDGKSLKEIADEVELW